MSTLDSTEPVALISAVSTDQIIGDDRPLPPTEMNTRPLIEEQVTGLSLDPGEHVKSLDQATLFRAVDEGNVDLVSTIVHTRKVDVNAYNDEGLTAIFLAVYKYESHRNAKLTQILIQNGAKVSIRAAVPPSAHKLSIVRHDKKHHGEVILETKKISLDHKTPLLVALELKSSLYLKGWEYRHWDDLINVLAAAQVVELQEQDLRQQEAIVPAVVLQGWAAVYAEGNHELVEVWADGHYLCALRSILVANSKVLKFNLEAPPALGMQRLEMKEASFNVVKKLIEFMYTGQVDPEFMQSRGVDLFRAAHVYGVESLKHLCETLIVCTPENWIKLLTAATDANSDALTLKCAKAIHGAMDKRMDYKHVEKPVFSDSIHPDGGPIQLFTTTDE